MDLNVEEGVGAVSVEDSGDLSLRSFSSHMFVMGGLVIPILGSIPV